MEDNRVEMVQKYIDGLDWPASKDEVLRAAERNGAPDEVLQKLQQTDAESFAGPNAVHNSLWAEA